MTGGRKKPKPGISETTSVISADAGTCVQLIATARHGARGRTFVMPESRRPPGDLHEQMSEEGLTITDGKLKVPDGPGLGITIRPEGMNELIDGDKWEE